MSAETEQPDPDDPPIDRWELIRDALTFQVKLAIDGLRDLLLLPLSAAGAFLNLLGVRGTPIDFYRLVRWGKMTERKINLFGAARRSAKPRSEIDGLVVKLERLLVDQYKRGGVTANAKDAIDRILDGVQRSESDR